MPGAVRIESDGDVAVVVIDNPPVNAAAQAVRAGILDAMGEIAGDPRYAAAVLIGAGTTFISGSDLREFAGPIAEPEMPAVIVAIEACPKPVVAALSGSALGGGLEVALACDARVALPGTLVGLPEVTLGIIPGAGGTVRLPRLVGVPAAVDLIVSGRRIRAEEARRLGVIDEIVSGDLRPAAVAHARGLRRKRRVVERAPQPADPSAVDAAVDASLKKARRRPAAVEAVAAIRRAAELPVPEALRLERAAFQRLRESGEAAALRHLFFAERAALRAVPPPADGTGNVTNAGIVGSGTMGRAISLCFADAGYSVRLVDVDQAALDRAHAWIRDTQARAARSGRLTQAEADARLDRIRLSTTFGDLADADLVVEAVFEDAEVKRKALAEIETVLPPGTLIASNTSYLDLDDLAAMTSRAGDFVGLHFFAPANVMRLVEVVRCKATTDRSLATAFAVSKRLGKLPILAGNREGFIGNRLYSAYRSQCEFMLEEGCLPRQIDAALQGFGFAMGPFATGDLSGLDIAWRNRLRHAASRDPRVRYAPALDRLCEMGRFGRKTGAGWYAYPAPDAPPEPDPTVARLLEEIAREKGIARRAFDDEEIVMRALAAIVNEAALLLAEGVSRAAADVDLVMVNGFGFPSYRGGPLFWAAGQPRATLLRAIESVAQAVGFGFRRGAVSDALEP